MPAIGHAIYLHGFASSPRSSKATRFGRELSRLGVGFSCPDFNVPDFESLTVTRMLEQTAEAIAAAGRGPVALIGSSLGAFVAVLASARTDAQRVDRLILLAPALDFGGNRLRQLGDQGIEEWRTRGSLRLFHYADNTHRDVGFQLYEDAARHDAFAVRLRVPALVFQGRRDESVDPAMVERWTRSQPAQLRLLDDDHQLTTSLDAIWEESREFLGLV
jgi:pimeloyl-ACP methyl ester carboxylesterase